MENEYTTKEMKPTEVSKKAPEPKVHKDGEIYQQGSGWKFKIGGTTYSYKTKELAEAGLLIVNG
jgi:hypothetical protein